MPVLKFGHAAIAPSPKIQTIRIDSFTQRRSAYCFFFSYLSIIQSVSRKLWSEVAWFRFLAHLSFTAPSILNLNLYLLPFEASIYSCDFALSLFWTVNKEISDTPPPTSPFFFALSSFAFDQNFRFNYGYQCNNQIVWCAINQNKEYKQSKFKENNKDKSIQWTKSM